MELSGAPPFDEASRGDPSATRAYRALLADDEAAACAWLETDAGRFVTDTLDLSDPCRPIWTGHAGGLAISVAAAADAGGVVVRYRVVGDGSDRTRIPVRLRVRCRLDRPALAEITELEPPPPTGAVTRMRPAGRRLRVAAEALPAEAELMADAGSWRLDAAGDAVLEMPWAIGDGRQDVALRCLLGVGGGTGAAQGPRAGKADSVILPAHRLNGRLSVPPDLGQEVRRLVERAVAYVRGCTALAVEPDERTLLADHRLLPLSWTRDGYWQAALLLATDELADTERVADHLRWLFRRCERPDGRWVRSHHADGRRKDLAFQADQQLYPLLELADWWRAAGGLPAGVAWGEAVPAAWQAALDAVHPEIGLIGSTENPADDPTDAPFIASTQILLWYAATRLAELAGHHPIGLSVAGLQDAAKRCRAAFDRHLVADGLWAYATDLAGGRVECHDANDLPTALAPLLGFCGADDPAWRATMAFAFSPANPWCVGGRNGGLGSAHTPGPWTLGDLQAWVAGSLMADAPAARAALQRLIGSAFSDGMLPEVTARGGDTPPIRHWFAWPGAALGALVLFSSRGLLDLRLGPGARSVPSSTGLSR